jgi:16S rRNA (adenine1518-N6/adenine1519-N6)-dimethyltransferase
MKQHRARKRFGQNFLTDSTVVDRIIHSINPQPDEKLVEIGPGLGALTCPLITATGELDVIELDRDIIPKLRLNCGLRGKLTIHNADVLRFDFNQIYDPQKKLRIVGNLPYNISTPIIFHLVEYADKIHDMHFMLQKEVVERLAAAPGNSDYGRLSVMAQYRFRVTPLFLVPPEAFDPRPKVESAIVKLTPYKTPPVAIDDEQLFASLVKQAFSQRRKTIRNVLKNLCTPEQLAAADIDTTQRPEQLDLQQFARLSNVMAGHS